MSEIYLKHSSEANINNKNAHTYKESESTSVTMLTICGLDEEYMGNHYLLLELL